jgi:succinate semialdehyde reductase
MKSMTKLTPDPAIETVEQIQKEFEGKNISTYIGLGGGVTGYL